MIFASTCENLPFVILEAMSFGMPIITSNKRPMSDLVVGENILFDSYSVDSIKSTILNNINNKKLNILSRTNYYRSKKYRWKENIVNTLEFINSCI